MTELENKLTIFVLSDGTGETAEQLVNAALVQFERKGLKIVRYKNIRTEAQVDDVFAKAKNSQTLVIHTVVSEGLRKYIADVSTKAGTPGVDLLGPLMEHLSQYLKKDPHAEPGLFHQVNEYYFKRIDAIEYTVKHDDGRYPTNLAKADIILVGLSRTSKTPLSVYLSYKGWRVANVPIVHGMELPKKIEEIDQRRIIGLMIDSSSLVQIRRQRLVRMGDDPTSDYASLDHVIQEIEYAKSIFRQHRHWPVFDVTNKALEETATEVEKYIRTHFPEKFEISY